MIKITEKFIKELEIYKEINLHSNMGWTVTPCDQEQSTAAGLESIGKHPFELHLEKPAPGKTFCFLKTSGEIRGIEKYLRKKKKEITGERSVRYRAAGTGMFLMGMGV